MSFDFNIPVDAIDNSLYKPKRESYPGIAYYSTLRGEEETGFFIVDKASVERLGVPGPFWNEEPMRRKPGEEPTTVYKTTRFRMCPIAVRKRSLIETPDGRTIPYPLMTKRENREEGRYKAHFQIMCMVPGLSEPVVLGLKGFTKTVSWENNPDAGKYFQKEFPVGVWQKVLAYTNLASEQRGQVFPALCFWWIDLVPAYDTQGKPHLVSAGHNATTVVNPFSVDLRTNDQDARIGLDTRFVGLECLLRFQDIRKEVGIAWEEEWEDAEQMAQEADVFGGGDDLEEESQGQAEEDWDIPF